MSPAARTFAALAAGLALGAGLRAALPAPSLDALLAAAEPLGTTWVNAIRMTVVPLVASLLVGAVAADDARVVGRLGLRVAVAFAVSLGLGAALVLLVTPTLLARLPVPPPDALAALGAGAAPLGEAVAPVGLRDWLVGLIPTNPVKAAADGALLPLVVFTLAFAAAATRIPEASRAALVGVSRAVADALLVVVRWVLALAPLGVFALALPLGARAGAAAAGALAGYVVLTIALCLTINVGMYVGAITLGRVPLRTFARAAAPAQAVALGTRSSLAALPAMLRGAEQHLALPPASVAMLLPLAVATFRISVTVAIIVGTLFLARLAGVELTAAQQLGVGATAVLLSVGVPGVPGGVFLVMAPVLTSVGVPAAGVGLLLAVDPITDAFRTLTNVTGHMALTAIVGRESRTAGVVTAGVEDAGVATAQSGAQ
ncbi:cation:dicarboxylase symporter family transporter [Roseisolibacter sp. H3M3-2]|uniref:dicarboxylate/amino acid:cation symporter n=1 Tax=Roseisolibacter sp. H3M3-2 TaxID=3031323 RepID=UPI0023DC6D70|nr:cation:dicarboxylase symporter family transporter [Roseisolibacter sp. H3M3-2]MDF1503562.1 cation:dicarboxylase symporter family transporter [Roseisolibacter sp. H3M3-2]